MITLATYDVGLNIGVEGDADFKKQLSLITQQSKELAAEMKAVTSAFDKNDNSEQKAAATAEVLTKQIDVQQQKIGLLKGKLEDQEKELDKIAQEYQKVAKEQGADSKEAQKLSNDYAVQAKRVSETKTQINNAETAMNSMKREMQKTDQVVEETSEDLKSGGQSAVSFGTLLKANVASQAIITGVKALASAVKQVAQEIVNTVKETAKWADELNTLSQQTGLSTDKLQEFEYMAGLIDVDVSTITGSLRKLTNNMQSAASGTGSAYEAFNSLGVSVTDADGALRNNYDVFLDVIDALGKMTNETERDALSMDIFGRSAMELNPLIIAGSDAIQDYADEAHEMGYVLDQDAVGKLLETQDALDRLQNTFTGFKNTMVASIAPGITEAINSVMSFLKGDTSLEDFLSQITEKTHEIAETMPERIEEISGAIVENMPTIIEAGIEIITALLTGIIQSLPTLIGKLPEVIFKVAEGLLNSLPKIFEVGRELINNLILGIINYYAALDAKGKEIGDKIAQSIWNGLKNAYEWIKSKIQEWVGNVLDFIKRLFGIGSGAATAASGTMGVTYDYSGLSGVQSNNTFNITQSPGEDGFLLAQRINSQLGRIYG